MRNEELAVLKPEEVGQLAKRMASLSPEHALAILDGVAMAVLKLDHTHSRGTQSLTGELLAFGTRLLDSIQLLRAIVFRRVNHGHKVTFEEDQVLAGEAGTVDLAPVQQMN